MTTTDWIGWAVATAICLLAGWWLHRPADEAPEWANWIAQDADGSWWYYEYEPEPNVLGSWCPYALGDFEFVRKDAPNPNWRTTLARVRR